MVNAKRVICIIAILADIARLSWTSCDPCVCKGNRMTCRGRGTFELSKPSIADIEDTDVVSILHDPNMTTLDPLRLKKIHKLRKLKVEQSGLRRILRGTFDAVSVDKLHVPNNRLMAISWKALSSSSHRLSELDIDGNPIDCHDCTNLWLSNIDYRYSKLLSIPYANGSKSIINCLTGCPNDITVNNIFSLPERTKFKQRRKCSVRLNRTCAAPTMHTAIKNVTDENNGKTLQVTCTISSKKEDYLRNISLFYAYDNVISDDEAIMWHQTSMRSAVYTIRNLSSTSSGWFLCAASTETTPLLATLPVIIYGKPRILLEDIRKAEKSSDTHTLYIWFHLAGLPRPNFNMTSIHPGSHQPKVSFEPADTLHFYALQGALLFQHHSSWKFLCLGRYKLSACNSYGCDQKAFDLLGYPDSCSQANLDLKATKYGNDTNATSVGGSTKQAQSLNPLAETAVIASVFTVAVLTITVGYLCMKLKHRTKQRKRIMQSPNKADVTLIAEDEMCLLAAQNQLYFTWLHDLAQRTDIPVFNENCISVVRQLGEGAFGCVLLVDVYSTGESVPMAMKVIKPNVQDRLCDLEQEAKILSGLDHPNIVKFYGLSQQSGRSALLFEYMEGGDLVNYIRDRKPSIDEGQTALCLKELTDISLQIATGMEYLHLHRLVHRDLAARNCLVGSGLVIKISDFGMTRDVYVTDYYKMDSRTLVPLRWLPPESILYRRFTTESDVWSFGVVMWEIFSYGQVPWCMFSNHEVLEQVTSGNILGRPADCPSHIYGLMKRCWEQEPSDRMKMASLKMEFLELNATLSEATCTTKL